MSNYTASEYFDMALVLGSCNNNRSEAVREYARRYPDRRLPDSNVLQRLECRARETGSLVPSRQHDGVGPHPERMRRMEEDVVNLIYEDPTRSTRQVARQLQISKSAVHRILKGHNFHPYHFTSVQKLHPQDYGARLTFCRWLQQRNQIGENFSQRILFSDECLFTQEGIFNCHNYHWWDEVNPFVTRERSHQIRWKINVWAGVIGNQLIGPYVLPPYLNGSNYTDFLRDDLPGLLEDVPLAIRRCMYYQHDGAPAHYAATAREILDTSYPGRWIGRGGPTSWPARSPDLNPLDFFLWGYLKELVYRKTPETENELQQKLNDAVVTIDEQTLSRVQVSLRRRLELCIEKEGLHFEQFL